MKRIYDNDLNGNIPQELESSINALMDATPVPLEDIDTHKLEALGKRELIYRTDRLDIFLNPLVAHRTDYVSLNPNKQGQTSTNELFSLTAICIKRRPTDFYEIPSVKELLHGMKFKKGKIIQYDFGRFDGRHEIPYADSTPLIPFYNDNPDYIALIKFIESYKESK